MSINTNVITRCQSSWKDWCDYNANECGLKEAIKIIENTGGN